jgi:hypothetical protein
MKRLRKIAISDNVQRVYEDIISNVTLNDMIKYANLFRQSWNNGLDTNMVDSSEKNDSNLEWVKNYHVVISQDMLTKAKKDPDVLALVSVLSEEENNDLFNMLNEYVLSNAQQIADAIED